MALSVMCKCGKRLLVKPEHVGKRVKCPTCAQIIDVVPASLPANLSSKKATVTTRSSHRVLKPRKPWRILAAAILIGLFVGSAFFLGTQYPHFLSSDQSKSKAKTEQPILVQGKKEDSSPLATNPNPELNPSEPKQIAETKKEKVKQEKTPLESKKVSEVKEETKPPAQKQETPPLPVDLDKEKTLVAPKKQDPPPVVAKALRPKEFTNSIGMRLVFIPAGTFRMGTPSEEKWRMDEEEEHDVDITQPFYLGKFEVTQAQYQLVMGSNPSHHSGEKTGFTGVVGMDTRDFPVEEVTFEQAKEFCTKLSKHPTEKESGRAYALPTEAQWEYACRGGSRTVYHFGKSISADQANFKDSEKKTLIRLNAKTERPTKVGSYAPNAFGLHDMHGNVWEWCEDFYDSNYYRVSPRKDPKNVSQSDWHVLRGGSCLRHERFCRSGCRDRRPSQGPQGKFFDVGFRVVLQITPDLKAQDAKDIASLPLPKFPTKEKDAPAAKPTEFSLLAALPNGIEPLAVAKAKRLVVTETKWIKIAAHPSGAAHGFMSFADIKAKGRGFCLSYTYTFTGTLKEKVKTSLDFVFDSDGSFLEVISGESNAIVPPFVGADLALLPLRQLLIDNLKKERDKSKSVVLKTGISLTEKLIDEAKAKELLQLCLQAKQVLKDSNRVPTPEEEWDNKLVERSFVRGLCWNGLSGKTQIQVIQFDGAGDMAYVVSYKNAFGEKSSYGCSGPYTIKLEGDKVRIVCKVKEVLFSESGNDKHYTVGGITDGGSLIFSLNRFGKSKDKNEVKNFVVGVLSVSTSEPFRKLTEKLPAGGGRFFIEKDIDESRYLLVEFPVVDGLKYKDAITQVLVQDSQCGANVKSSVEAAREMRRIDLSKCPVDFREAYGKHISAWERYDHEAIAASFYEYLRISTKYRVHTGPFE